MRSQTSFMEKVEEVTGNKVTPEKLGAAIQTDQRQAPGAGPGATSARKYKKLPISGKDALLVIARSPSMTILPAAPR